MKHPNLAMISHWQGRRGGAGRQIAVILDICSAAASICFSAPPFGSLLAISIAALAMDSSLYCAGGLFSAVIGRLF
jgi:hypothetical protein